MEPNQPILGMALTLPPAAGTSLLPPTQAQTNPTPRSEDGWVTLSEFTPATGTKPPSNMGFPDGSQSPITLWRQLEQHTVVWLWHNNLLTSTKVPVASSNQRYIVNAMPQHQEGNSFVHTIPIPGTPLFLEGNVSSRSATANAKKLLQHCGVDPATVYVQVSQ